MPKSSMEFKGRYVKTAREKAEDVRRRLLSLSVLDKDRGIIRDDEFIYFPVLRAVSLPGCVVVRKKACMFKARPRSLRDALRERLSESELALLPSAFDLVGDIAVLDLPDVLLKRSRVIANALLGTFRNIHVVAVKVSPVSLEYRVRGVKVIAGEKRTVTVHKEHGRLYKVDVSSVYFSPRLGGERMRVASKVMDGERVLVMFAGIGPYVILIARKRRPREVVAVELNPKAVDFMRENVALNKVGGVVKVVEGDVRNVVPNLGRFDRIIMPLPKDAGDFLDVALPAANKNCVVHFYNFASTTEESAKKAAVLCRKLGYRVKILDAVYCGSYSPELSRVCVDFKVLGRNK